MKNVWLLMGGLSSNSIVLGVYRKAETAHKIAKEAEANSFVVDGIRYLGIFVRQYKVCDD